MKKSPMQCRQSFRFFPYPPFFVAVFLCVSLYAANRLYFSYHAVILPLCVLSSFIVLALLFCTYVLRLDLNKGQILISGGLFLNFTFYFFCGVSGTTGQGEAVSPFFILYALLWVGLIILLLVATSAQAKGMVKILGVLSIILVLVSLANLSFSVISDSKAAVDESQVFEAKFQKSISKDLGSSLNNRDFYFILIDRYAGEETLYAGAKSNNSGFYERLTSLGFTVLQKSRSNYGVTRRSIPSMLNMDYYASMKKDGYNVEHNRLFLFFKSQGFTFVFLPSNWVWTTKNDNADIVLNPYPITLKSDSRNLIFQKIMFFERTLVGWIYYKLGGFFFNRTMPEQSIAALQKRIQNLEDFSAAVFNKQFGTDHLYRALAQSHVPKTFEALARIPQIPGKKFIFSHINHWEYVKKPTDNALTNVNQSIESLVRVLIEESDPDPVIVIMSDHGGKPYSHTVEENRETYARYARYPKGHLEQKDISGSWYTLDNIEMFYLPDGGDAAVYPGMTPVNAWRMVLNYYFGTDFKRLQDKAFWKWRYAPGIVELE